MLTTIFVNVRWTYSRSSLSFLWYGLHALTQYSTYGLTGVSYTYRLTIIPASVYLIVLFIIPITSLALLNAYKHWSEHFISDDIDIPGSFSVSCYSVVLSTGCVAVYQFDHLFVVYCRPVWMKCITGVKAGADWRSRPDSTRRWHVHCVPGVRLRSAKRAPDSHCRLRCWEPNCLWRGRQAIYVVINVHLLSHCFSLCNSNSILTVRYAMSAIITDLRIVYICVFDVN